MCKRKEGRVFNWVGHLLQEGSFLSENMDRLYNPEPWHQDIHLLPVFICQFTVDKQTSASLLTEKTDV